MLGKTEQEMLWINAWNDLYDLIGANENLSLVNPEWCEISLEDAQEMIQSHAYTSQKVHFEQVWYLGKPAIRLTFSAALE